MEIASKINKIIDDKDLTDLGKLEQDLVFGDATSKEIITYISTNQKMSAEDKVCCHFTYILLQSMRLYIASSFISCCSRGLWIITLLHVWHLELSRFWSMAAGDLAEAPCMWTS